MHFHITLARAGGGGANTAKYNNRSGSFNPASPGGMQFPQTFEKNLLSDRAMIGEYEDAKFDNGIPVMRALKKSCQNFENVCAVLSPLKSC